MKDSIAATKWTVARAKERFSELLRAVARAPQPIYNRDRLVAVVVDAATFRGLVEAREKTQRRSLGDAFAELRRICQDEGYTLEVADRSNRANPFPELLDELPG